ncbi:MAG: SH3 domain-containing protein [Lachnospiraceae bacterium]
MAEEKDYVQILNRVRKKRNKRPRLPYILAGLAAAVVVVGAVIFAGRNTNQQTSAEGETPAAAARNIEESEPETTMSAEEIEAQREAEEKQAVVDAYSNLGLAQVSGYLNVRETVGESGKIIGKLQQNSVCEILGTEGDWYHISSGGIEGYIHSQYVLTGDEAKAEALQYVAKMAIVNTEKLNIRQEPVIDPSNVLGQALINERYEVAEESEGWVRIAEGYISSEFVTVTYAMNEARKLDLRAMALNQYDNLVISKVDGYLNLRSSPENKGMENVIGKFPSRAAGEILETLDGWYKIKSGSITGYITAESQYVATGQEARELALEAASLMAIVNTDKLNVRSEPSTESSIWTQISKEDRYSVVEQLDGWVQIELDSGDEESGENKAFIATRENNIEVRYALAEAIKFSPLEERANQQASARSKVVNYALQFVGNRYVWGGTNPNTGADCSGFVQYVLRNSAGVSLPRTSREQAKTGQSIKSSDMKPGDLIYYTNKSGVVNHVAMYIGNGQIVHAASTKSGIRISTWNYRTPKYIRSYLD